MNKNKILSGGGKNLTGGGKWGWRGREVGGEGEGSGVKGGGKWGERGREVGVGYPPVHPLIYPPARLSIYLSLSARQMSQPAPNLGPLSARQRNAFRMEFRWRAIVDRFYVLTGVLLMEDGQMDKPS